LAEREEEMYDYSGLAAFSAVFFIIAIGFGILGIIIFWKIFSKAGYSGAMSLLMLVPIANIVVLCILAFGEWPIYRELNYLRQQAGRNPQFPGQYGQYQPFLQPQAMGQQSQYPSFPQPQYPGQYPQRPATPNPQSSNPNYPNYQQPQG
jgi:hypothetical protein